MQSRKRTALGCNKNAHTGLVLVFFHESLSSHQKPAWTRSNQCESQKRIMKTNSLSLHEKKSASISSSVMDLNWNTSITCKSSFGELFRPNNHASVSIGWLRHPLLIPPLSDFFSSKRRVWGDCMEPK